MAYILSSTANNTLSTIEKIAKTTNFKIHREAQKQVSKNYRTLLKIINNNKAKYGINTGFGALAEKKIPIKKLNKLQSNIIKSHSTAAGKPFAPIFSKIALALRLQTFLYGHSGVSLDLCQEILFFLNNAIYPVIYEYGSVGASGDLVPLAHIALAIQGQGSVFYRNKIMKTAPLFKKLKKTPYQFKPKEGLSFVNGTTAMLSVGSLALLNAFKLYNYSLENIAIGFEMLKCNPASLTPFIHKLRPQKGQLQTAKTLLNILKKSYLLNNKEFPRVQDPYSYRCSCQVLGGCLDQLNHCKQVLEIEMNSVTDNPIIKNNGEVISGGNFHGQPLSFVFDLASIALAAMANIADRRIEIILNPKFNMANLFLTQNPGIESGYMSLQYLTANLVNENKILATPASVDSIPGNNGIEDFVSMGIASAKKFFKITINTAYVLAGERLALAKLFLINNKIKLTPKNKNKINKLIQQRLVSKQEAPISENINLIARNILFASKMTQET